MGTFPVEMLRDWKTSHEAWVDSWGDAPKFGSFRDMAVAISEKLLENRMHWEMYGPNSETAQNDPASNVVATWTARKLDCILPNNRAICRMLQDNMQTLPEGSAQTALTFVAHARAFEENQYERRDWYPLFPNEFSQLIEGIINE